MKFNSSLKMITVSVVASMLFIGCGESSDSTPQEPTTSTGTFVDAPVQGLAYKTATQKGFTDASGHFLYVNGEEVEFKLGTLSLGKGTAGGLITPYTISENNETATNIALLLQNFDSNRSNAGVIDISKLKDYDFSDVNLSASNTVMETKITALISAIESNPAFGSGVLDANTTVITAENVKTAMDDSIKENSISVESGFGAEWLKANKMHLEGGYMEFVDGICTIRNADGTQMKAYTDSGISGVDYNQPYSIENGILKVDESGIPAWDDATRIKDASSSDRYQLFKVKSVAADRVTVYQGQALSNIDTFNFIEEDDIETFYLTKEAVAKANTITIEYGFGTLWIENNTMYIPVNDNGGKYIAEMKFEDGYRKVYINGTLKYANDTMTPYVIDSDGQTDVDETAVENTHQFTKVTAVSGTRIDVLTGETADVENGTMDKQVRFTNLADAQAYLETL